MESYRASYQPSVESILPAFQHHVRAQYTIRPIFIWALNFIIALLIFGALLLSFSPGSVISSLVLLLFAVYLTFYRPLTVWNLVRLYKKQSIAPGNIEWEILPDKITLSQPNGVFISMPWNEIQKVIEIEEGYLLFPQKTYFLWLPRQAFESPEAGHRLIEYARSQGVASETTQAP